MRRGFTLVETLVAVTILAIAIAGPMYAASRALVAAQNSNHQLTASLLAQEALEHVRQMRDDQYLDLDGKNPSGSWSVFEAILDACEGANKCTVDVFSGNLPAACGGSCAPLNLSSTKQYIQGTGTPTPYTRSIRVRDVQEGGLPDIVGQEITARVDWTFRGAPYFVEVKDILMPWQPRL